MRSPTKPQSHPTHSEYGFSHDGDVHVHLLPKNEMVVCVESVSGHTCIYNFKLGLHKDILKLIAFHASAKMMTWQEAATASASIRTLSGIST